MAGTGIKYRFAETSDGHPVCADDVAKLSNFDPDSFRCLQCKRVMNARVHGAIQRPHFGHRAGEDCPFASYMEHAAATFMADAFNRLLEDGLSLYINPTKPVYCSKFKDVLGHSCDTRQHISQKYDVTQWYDYAEARCTDERWTVDLSPRKSHFPPLVIVPTYDDPHNFAARNFGDQRVIEILIPDENGLEPVRAGQFDQLRMQFHNLNRELALASDEQCRCKFEDFTLLIVYESNKIHFENGPLESLALTLRKQRNSAKYYVFVRTRRKPWEARTSALRMLRTEGRDVRHCLICRSYERKYSPDSDKTTFCRAKNQFCESNAGANCELFSIEPLMQSNENTVANQPEQLPKASSNEATE